MDERARRDALAETKTEVDALAALIAASGEKTTRPMEEITAHEEKTDTVMTNLVLQQAEVAALQAANARLRLEQAQLKAALVEQRAYFARYRHVDE